MYSSKRGLMGSDYLEDIPSNEFLKDKAEHALASGSS